MDIRFSEKSKRFAASAIRNKLFDNPELITFAAGKPEASIFPLDAVSAALNHVIEHCGREALQYGPTEGIAQLREQIAQERMKACGVKTGADNIFLTSGSQEAIELSARIFVNEGDYIACESPSYTGAFGAIAPYAAKYVSIPMDENGMIMEELEKALRENPNIKMIYTIPDFQNPTGVTMSDDRRKRLAELAAKYKVPVVEDCPYGDLIFEGERHPAVKSFDCDGWVIMLGSFSKIFLPGIRIGWICASSEIIEKYMLAKQGLNLQCSTLDQYMTAEFLRTNDIQAHITKIQDLYRERRDLMTECIRKYLPEGIRFTMPHGGFFIWLELDPRLNAGALLLDAARDYKVAYIPGKSFFADEKYANYIRLSYSCVSLEQIETGMKRLGTFLHKEYEKLQ